MADRKKVRTRGKFSFRDFFQAFKEGDTVAVVRERALTTNFPERLQGRTGTVVGKRGRAYICNIKDQNKPKQYLILPVHLKKIENTPQKQ